VALRPKVSPALRVAFSLAAVMPLLAAAEHTTIDGPRFVGADKSQA
jgi:hypothetical protein